jgi:hypothetical protein
MGKGNHRGLPYDPLILSQGRPPVAALEQGY